MRKEWTGQAVLELARSYQPACVLLAAAELEIFDLLAERPMTAADLASALQGDPRATTILADALSALGFLEKRNDRYLPASGVVGVLTASGAQRVLPMLHHQANLVRSWAQLATVVKTGRAAGRLPSVRGERADRAAFIEAMDVTNRDAAPKVVASLGALEFQHMLDIGCGPGTWSVAFLGTVHGGKATLYDLPEVIPIARRHIEEAGLRDRVDFVAGDYTTDEKLPEGVDLAWVSAVVHQNSRAENRALFTKVHAALTPGGRIMIRDIVMEDSHTSPPGGAMFAVNMVVRTEGGGTYSFSELREDLRHAGFGNLTVVRGERDMDSVVVATKL